MGSTGTDTFEQPAGADSARADPMLAGVRRLTLLADGAAGGEEIFRGLARELLLAPGAEEVHVHHLLTPPAEEEPVVVYLCEGDGRLSYLAPRSERPAGVSWVVNTARSFLAADARELQASLPRIMATGKASCALLLPVAVRGEVEAVVALVRARAEAGTDAVTGCMNHRGMRRRLHEEIGRAMRTGSPLSCMLIDLDNFKLVNDRHGHQAGDTVLREVGQALVGEFRAFDRVARYGGDEFVVILPNAELESAAAAASRALTRLRDLPSREINPSVGASIGVAQWSAPMGADTLLQACDAALLRSKRQGKGRVTRAAAPAR